MGYIGVWNLEPQFQNIALEKIKKYHIDLGNRVEEYTEDNVMFYDKIYVSSIFTFTPKDNIPAKAICGGTGFDVELKLPPEIEAVKPRTNCGFTTRGCPNKCPWCVVPRKEGDIKPADDITNIWDGKSGSITLLDNNILALPDRFKDICKQLIKLNTNRRKKSITVDFNQGLDIRRVDNDIAKLLSSVSFEEHRFAFDTLGLDTVIRDKVPILRSYGINRSKFYMLVGFNTTIFEDFYRLNLLKGLNQNPYVMRYRKIYDSQPESLITSDNEKLYIAMANWANVPAAFRGMTFSQYLEHERGRRYKQYFEDIIQRLETA